MDVFVYILHSRLDYWYTGLSKDVYKRLEQHRSQQCISTRNRGFFSVVFFQKCNSYQDARALEVAIKQQGAYKWLRYKLFTAYLFKNVPAQINVQYLRNRGVILPYHLVNPECLMHKTD